MLSQTRRLAAIFTGTGAIAVAGTAVNRHLDPTIVLLGFAALMVLAGIRMLRNPGTVGGACALPGAGINWRSCLPRAIGAGLAVGFLTGLFGVGGGFLIIPALVVLLGLPMPTAVATSLIIIAADSVAGFAAHLGEAPIALRWTAAFTVTAIMGALGAGRLANRLSAERLRRWFAYPVLAVAAYIVIRTFEAKGL